MTKQEIIEAINSTIIANGQKGITAESLNLILNEIVDNSGEAGSGGSDNDGEEMFVFQYPSSLQEYDVFDDFVWGREWYMENLDIISEIFRDDVGIENFQETIIHQTFMSSFDNNERVLRQIQEKYQNGKNVSNIKFDLSIGIREIYDVMGISEMAVNEISVSPIMTNSYLYSHGPTSQWTWKFSISNETNALQIYVVADATTECTIWTENPEAPSPSVYLNANDSEKEQNKLFFEDAYVDKPPTQVTIFDNGSFTVGVFGTCITSSEYTTYFFEDSVIKKLVVTSNGEATVSIVGNITAA